MPSTKKVSFQDDWLKNPIYGKCIRRVPDNVHSAQCILCHTNFGLSNMGKAALDSHISGKKHQKAVLVINSSYNIRMFGSAEESRTTSDQNQNLADVHDTRGINKAAVELNAVGINSEKAATTNKSHGLSQFLIKQDVIKAEIMWAMATVIYHILISTAGKCTELFSAMFPSSPEATGMLLGRTKLSYVINYGLAPYFLEELLAKACESEAIVIYFDESFNKSMKATQMDFAIGFWNDKRNQTSIRYFTSAFLGHSTSNDLLTAFLSSLVPFMLKKLLNISMDGPNVNLKFIKELKTKLISEKTPESQQFLSMGSCGLHTCNNAFKEGAKATKWTIAEFLRSIHYLFKDSSARREDYILYSGSEEFALKFCSVRWLCNGDAAERALKILPCLRKYVDGVCKDKKEKSIKCKSYQIMKNCLEDKLLAVKIAFFGYVAAIIEPFLREFQAAEPLGPLLFSSLQGIVVDLFKIFVKREVLEKSTNVAKIDLNSPENLKMAANIDFKDSFSINSELKKAKTASQKEILIFKNECIIFLKTLCTKLLEKSPLKYDLCRGISCCDPSVIINCSSATTSKRLDTALSRFQEGNWLSTNECDKIKKEFVCLIDKRSVRERCKDYKRCERLDTFWISILNSNSSSSELRRFIKFVLLISHGNAFVERGFSVNKEMIIENQKKNSLVSLRQVYDGITEEGGITDVKISQKMIDKVLYSRREYTAALEKEKKLSSAANNESLKKKKLSEKLKELHEKKRSITLEYEKQTVSIEEDIQTLSFQLK